MNRLFAIADGCVGIVKRLQGNVVVGADTSVRWSRINGRGGSVRIGRDGIIHCRVHFDGLGGRVVIGDRCFLGASTLVCRSNIELGDDVIMSWGVTIVDHNSHSLMWAERQNDVSDWKRGEKDWSHVKTAPVRIGNRVWIGFGASILKGVSVGDGAVVGACAVVTRDVPAQCVVAGNPAVIVRQL